jgi:hypothetical protein
MLIAAAAAAMATAVAWHDHQGKPRLSSRID